MICIWNDLHKIGTDLFHKVDAEPFYFESLLSNDANNLPLNTGPFDDDNDNCIPPIKSMAIIVATRVICRPGLVEQHIQEKSRSSTNTI